MKKRFLLLCSIMLAVVIVGCTDDDPAKSSEKQLLSFDIKGEQATIIESDKNVTLSFTSVVSLSSLTPTISVSDKASISPASGEAQDFTSPVEYTITAEDGTAVVYTVTITSVDITTHNPSVSSSSTALTPGQSITIIAEEIEGASYSWYSQQVGLLQTTTTNTYTITSPGTYWVVITAGGASSLASEPIVITVPFSSLKPTITAESFSLCNGGSVELRIENTEDFSTATTFVWSKDGNEIDGVTSTVYYATEVGSYTVLAQSGSETSETSEEGEVTHGLAQPVLQTSPSGENTAITVQNIADYSAGTTFIWYNNGGVIMGNNTPTLIATGPGQYFIVAQNNSCQSLRSNPVVL